MKTLKYTYLKEKSILKISINNKIILSNDDKFIIYIYNNNEKIKSIYISKNNFNLPINNFINKIIKIKVFILKDNKSEKLMETEELLFTNIEKNKYNLIINGDYHEIKKNGYKCRPDAKPINIDNIINWYNPDRNIAFNLNSWRHIQPIWNEYFKNFEYKYILEIKNKILDYYSFMYDSSTRRKAFLWYDMSCAIRSIHLSLFKEVIDCFYNNNQLYQNEINMIVIMLNDHTNKLQEESFLSPGNHGLWQIIAIRLLSLVVDNDKNSLKEYSESKMTNLLNELINQDGFTSENSPDYHSYICNLLKIIPTDLFKNDAEKIDNTIKNCNNILQFFTDFDNRLFTIGDTEGQGYKFNHYNNNNGFSDLYLQDSNYYVYRMNNTKGFFCINASNKSSIHKHADNLSFILGNKGYLIVTDSGKYTYNNDEFRQHFISDISHNVLCLENHFFYPKNIVHKDSVLKLTKKENEFSVYGESCLREENNKFKWTRKVLYKNDNNFLFKDHIIQNDFNNNVFLNLVFSDQVLLKKNNNNNIMIYINNTHIANINIKSKVKTTKITSCWISKKYHEKTNSSNLKCYFIGDYLIWSINFV